MVGIEIDVATYALEGFLVVRSLLDAETIAVLQQATDELEAMAADFVRDSAVGRVYFEVQSASGRKREPAVFPGALRKITSPSKASPAFRALRESERLVELAAALGIASARCVVDQINPKLPVYGTGFPFHQDAAFLHGVALRDLEAFGGINVVVALDPTDAHNGGFTVLARTHTSGLVPGQYRYDASQTLEQRFDTTHRVVPTLAPGDAVFFSPWLAHGSGPNRSERRRRMATLWFVGQARSVHAESEGDDVLRVAGSASGG
ncbi:phytanoyl-CoA dioxygenase family protein [Myxococcota bacterium]|nr:phytanoyl-CoA dioxygenase family protein [Myxococcota bacterium]